ncbi:hypothetical protein A0J61_02866 [Choanephora cucurbitarum]|uniref:Uncharacterized protein n=1 Tax=Choanephora cucurbitarum TaxID=101091 RepID=A0A1C7NJ52_9FUNG|nr:hypothetical protein A0J61_02866 [Choanephora cucurbitarum]
MTFTIAQHQINPCSYMEKTFKAEREFCFPPSPKPSRYRPYPTHKPSKPDPLFGPVTSSSTSSTTDQPSLILSDDEVFDELDQYMNPSISFLSSPPPSPLLSPSNSEENDEDFDFDDFPLFP